MPKVSVIIPTYNYGKYIEKAIDSVLAQTCQDFEIIVVDDGSTDNTREIIEARYKDKVRYFYQENRGAPVARNFGLRKAEGEFVTFLDADDWLIPNSLSVRASYLKEHPEVDWVYGSGQYVDTRGEIVDFSNWKGLALGEDVFSALLLHGCFLMPFAGMMRRKDVLAIGGFNELLEGAQDYDLWLRISRGKRVAYIDVLLGKQLLHTSHISAYPEKSYRVHAQLLKEYWKDKDTREILRPVYADRISNIYNYLSVIYMRNEKQVDALKACMLSIINKPVQRFAYRFLWNIFTGHPEWIIDFTQNNMIDRCKNNELDKY